MVIICAPLATLTQLYNKLLQNQLKYAHFYELMAYREFGYNWSQSIFHNLLIVAAEISFVTNNWSYITWML